MRGWIASVNCQAYFLSTDCCKSVAASEFKVAISSSVFAKGGFPGSIHPPLFALGALHSKFGTSAGHGDFVKFRLSHGGIRRNASSKPKAEKRNTPYATVATVTVPPRV